MSPNTLFDQSSMFSSFAICIFLDGGAVDLPLSMVDASLLEVLVLPESPVELMADSVLFLAPS